MRERDFWRLIARARRATRRHARARDELRRRLRHTDSEEVLVQLGRLLEEEPLTRVVGFHRQLARVHRRAHRWDLWAAFGLALDGADPDDLRAALCWLILFGRREYTRVLRRPDRLERVRPTRPEVTGAGGLAELASTVLTPVLSEEDGAARAALERALGDLLLPIGDGAPHGTPVPSDALATLFPRLSARHLAAEGDRPVFLLHTDS